MKNRPASFTEFLRDELLKREWSQNRMAKEAGLSNAEISRLINGKQPSYLVCQRIAQAFNVSVDFVLTQAKIKTIPRDYDLKREMVFSKLFLLGDDEFELLMAITDVLLSRKKE